MGVHGWGDAVMALMVVELLFMITRPDVSNPTNGYGCYGDDWCGCRRSSGCCAAGGYWLLVAALVFVLLVPWFVPLSF